VTRKFPVPRNSPTRSVTTRTLGTVLAAATLLGTAACAGPAGDPTDGPAATPTASAVPHGFVAGAQEMPEPQLHLATVNAAGSLALLDLQGGSSTAAGTLDGVNDVTTDGRYLFASAAEAGTVTIVDTGVWTVDHEDHQHYYRAEPGAVGVVTGSGTGVAAAGGSLATVRFADSGTGIILDHGDLGDGTITELGRIDGVSGAGVLVPFGDRVIAGRMDAPGTAGAAALQVFDATGTPVAGATADCAELSGTITTRVGVVIGCADGAVLATAGADADSPVAFESIPYPDGVAAADRALAFANRAGRPTVAAVSGDSGAWLLDTRELSWTRLTTDTPLWQVVAVDDNDAHVVALTEDGRVLVLDPATGATLAATEPLLGATLAAAAADPAGAAALLAGVELTVDATRAYLNAPTDGQVYEIDFADNARIARTFPIDGEPRFLAETGR
jgi:hypothetical protein